MSITSKRRSLRPNSIRGRDVDSPEYMEMLRIGAGFGRIYFQSMNDADGVRSGVEMKEWIVRLMLEESGLRLTQQQLRLAGFTYGRDSCRHCGVIRAVYPFEFTRRDHCSGVCENG